VSAARWSVLAAITLTTVAGAAQAPAPPPAAPATATTGATTGATASPLLWNARERTSAGRAHLDAGDAAAAAAALDTAWQLEPERPLAAFNAGTGRLLAGRPDALPALEAAARSAVEAEATDPAVAPFVPDALFNLGNARLAAGDAAGAVEAYAETLRRAPRREDAKRNLELALRALERQQHQQQSQGTSARDRDTRDQTPGGEASESGGGEADPKQDEKTSREGEDQDRAGGEPGEGGEPQPQPGDERGDASNGTGDSSSATSAPPSSSSTESLSSSSSTEEPSPALIDPSTSRGAAPAGSRRRERLPGFVDQEEMTADEAAALLDAVEDLERQQRRQRALERARRRTEVEKDW